MRVKMDKFAKNRGSNLVFCVRQPSFAAGLGRANTVFHWQLQGNLRLIYEAGHCHERLKARSPLRGRVLLVERCGRARRRVNRGIEKRWVGGDRALHRTGNSPKPLGRLRCS